MVHSLGISFIYDPSTVTMVKIHSAWLSPGIALLMWNVNELMLSHCQNEGPGVPCHSKGTEKITWVFFFFLIFNIKTRLWSFVLNFKFNKLLVCKKTKSVCYVIGKGCLKHNCIIPSTKLGNWHTKSESEEQDFHKFYVIL